MLPIYSALQRRGQMTELKFGMLTNQLIYSKISFSYVSQKVTIRRALKIHLITVTESSDGCWKTDLNYYTF